MIMIAGASLAVVATIVMITSSRRRTRELRQLASVVEQVQAAAAKVRSACGELATGSGSVARGASDQAVRLLEASTSAYQALYSGVPGAGSAGVSRMSSTYFTLVSSSSSGAPPSGAPYPLHE